MGTAQQFPNPGDEDDFPEFQKGPKTLEKRPHREICGLCHRVSKVGFWVPHHIWKAVVHRSQLEAIHCLECFTERADESLIDWETDIKFMPSSLYGQIKRIGLETYNLNAPQPKE